jgi:hypothetical protein
LDDGYWKRPQKSAKSLARIFSSAAHCEFRLHPWNPYCYPEKFRFLTRFLPQKNTARMWGELSAQVWRTVLWQKPNGNGAAQLQI